MKSRNSLIFTSSKILLFYLILTGCKPESSKFYDEIQKYMEEDLDDPQKYEFVSLKGPDTLKFQIGEFEVDEFGNRLENAILDTNALHVVVVETAGPYGSEYSDPIPQENSSIGSRDSVIRFRVFLKYRYKQKAQKLLYGRNFDFDKDGKISQVYTDFLINH